MEDTNIFSVDGKMQPGWITVNMPNFHDKRFRLGKILEKEPTLCNAVGQNFSGPILQLLNGQISYLTDILLQADETGKYQAILLGGREPMGDERIGIHNAFHIIYLCSVSKGAGALLLKRLKDNLPPDLESITLEPLNDVREYYKSNGFVYATGEAEDGKPQQYVMIWSPKINTSGGKRRSNTTRRRRRKH